MSASAVLELDLSSAEGAVRAARRLYAWFQRRPDEAQLQEMAEVLMDGCHPCVVGVLSRLRREGKRMPDVPEMLKMLGEASDSAGHAYHADRDERVELATTLEEFWRRQAAQQIAARTGVPTDVAAFIAGRMWYSAMIPATLDAVEDELRPYPDGTPCIWVQTAHATLARGGPTKDRVERVFAVARKVYTEGEDAVTAAERDF